MIRTGLGFDIHPLVDGGPLRLGCVEIPWDRHLSGHSDGDCAAHAVADALLSAALSTDLGTVFPTNEANKGRSGASILKRTAELLKDHSCKIANIDLSILCDQPKLADYLEGMRKAIARHLGIKETDVTVKARHLEGLFPPTGIAAVATVLITGGDNG